MGKVKAIWVKRFKGGPMDRVDVVRMDPDVGVEGNAECSRKRQVTLLSVETWRDAQNELEEAVEPILRRANLLLEGVDLIESRGKTLQLGGVTVQIWGETRPCRKMEEAHAGLQAALDPDWRAGAHGEILNAGPVAEGDSARFVESETE